MTNEKELSDDDFFESFVPVSLNERVPAPQPVVKPPMQKTDFEIALRKWLDHWKNAIEKEKEKEIEAHKRKPPVNPLLGYRCDWIFRTRQDKGRMLIVTTKETYIRATGPDTYTSTWAMVASNGDIYAPGPYGRPAKWIRGNIQDETAISNCTIHGPKPIENWRHGFGDPDVLTREEIKKLNG